ncbi:MAG: response regulator [Oscillospiraceae bacterium]|nr:response regulator [Oscillospiraceae bacterium]
MNENTTHQAAELEALRQEIHALRRDREDRIRCESICNAAMGEALKQNHPDDEINCFLASIGRALDVDRIYIFEDDFAADETSNTYEWCAANVNPEIENLQDIPRNVVTWWYDRFAQGADIHIPDLEAIKDSEPASYSYLAPQGIHALIAKRIVLGESVIGFFGVDNPRLELMSDISMFLDTMSNFISSLIRNRNIFRSHETRYIEELEQKNTELNRALRSANEANAAKTLFLSNMSHDIRTPMNAIVGMTEIASSHIDDKNRVQDCLRKIMIAGRHLLGLINDVLDMAKIESGKMQLQPENISLRETMNTICGITRVQIKEKAQQLDIFISNILCENVLCDPLRLNQVMLNLVSNAIKYTQENGSICLRLWQEPSPKGDAFIRTHIAVSDTGMGMSEDFIRTIFDAFTREDVRRVQKTQGTGLGMAITKNIVDSMGGVIDVQSALGKGSTFHVTLDLRRVEDAEATVQLPAWKILVVDDSEEFCRSTAETLASLGTRPQWCTDGQTALELLEDAHRRGEDFFAVLVDYRMPGMNGIETTKRIHALLGEKTPVEMISAYDWSDVEADVQAAGIAGFVAKPLFRSTLYRELSRFVPDSSNAPSAQPGDEDACLTGRRVLLAEDNDINAEIASVILEELGIETERAADGAIAAEMFSRSAPGYYDVILMDLRMPRMNGFEATAAIRALAREDAAAVPIIAMTADAFAEDMKKCLSAGMNAHMAKPIDIDHLKKTLIRFIGAQP